MRELLRITLSIVLTMYIISNDCKSDGRRRTVDAETIMKRLAEGSNGLTPTVKDFDLEWVRSLTQRGEPTVYTSQNSSNFEYIGMPVCGIATGQLYLGGDGKLWYWDIFNNKGREHVRGVETYRNPYKRSNLGNSAYNNIDQGFAIQMSLSRSIPLGTGGQTQVRTLDRDGFSDIEFSGQYPIGTVTYRDADLPVSVKLEAFSPFVPLDLESSTYPATVLNYTIVNNSRLPVTGKITGWIENAVCLDNRSQCYGQLRNRIVYRPDMTLLFCDALKSAPPSVGTSREDIVYEDFESTSLDKWSIEGRAFSRVPRANYHHQPLRNHRGRGLADSFFNNGKKAGAKESDSPIGKMTSKPFTIQRRMIKFLMGGGSHPGQTCLNLAIDDKVVQTATGKNSERLSWEIFDVSRYMGKTAQIEIVDAHSGGWGHIMVDQIVFTDEKMVEADEIPFDEKRDYGSIALALLDKDRVDDVFARADGELPDDVFTAGETLSVSKSFDDDEKLVGSVGKKFVLRPGEETTVSYVLAWYFPNLYLKAFRGRNVGRSYGRRFSSARDVAEEIGSHYERLARQTHLWHNTWYDSTLPYWFLDRTFLNTSILATNTCYLFRDGRFYGYEGVYHGDGTCTHVWSYVQATGRLFPELEKQLRERVDYNPQVAFEPQSGRIGYRGEFGRSDAVDGHSGVILRTYREHQMSENDAFLRRNYEAVKKAMNYLINMYDADEDGILTGGQHNTLDAKWYGKITWLSLYYGAALRATGEMADEMSDREYGRYVRILAERGRKYIEEKLFNGEYFIHEVDPDHPKSPGVFNGCEYSQLLGQSWAYQVGLGQILDPEKVTTALNSLWKYNFSTDVGPFREVFKNGRWYAMPGEGGLIACTWPHGGEEALTYGSRHFAGYLNECQNGYEYGATSLMMWHGMAYRALAHTRTLHDRYHASKRNPWNEIEWGDHYSRSMASYGLFTAVSGFEYHGPKGYIAFSPRLTPENFKAAFTSAAGWGTFIQKIKGHTQTEVLELKYGHLRLQTLGFDVPDKPSPVARPSWPSFHGLEAHATRRGKSSLTPLEVPETWAIIEKARFLTGLTGVTVKVAGKKLNARYSTKGRRVIINLERSVEIKAGQSIEIKIKIPHM